jgi:adenylosuccinate synthase
LEDAVGQALRDRGQEYGAVTKRPRRCGWMDLPLLRYAVMINGISWLVITKLDVLDELPEIEVCTAYRVGGMVSADIPPQAAEYDKLEPVYTTLPGWRTSTLGITSMDKLPATARQYLGFLERETGARIGMISTGPGREQTIFVDEFAAALKTAGAAAKL